MKTESFSWPWQKNAVLPSPPKVTLDPTPSGTAEGNALATGSEDIASGKLVYSPEHAKLRIDTIARWLAICWSLFLAYLVLCQGFSSGILLHILNPVYKSYFEMKPFKLGSAEFIAVVTTTTASVFGFLVIVASHLFRAPKDR